MVSTKSPILFSIDFFFLFLILCAYCINLCIPVFSKNIFIIFLVYFLFVFLRSIKLNGIVSLYTIFLFLCFLFNFSRLYLDVIGYCDFSKSTFFLLKKVRFSSEVVSLSVLLFAFTMWIIDLGFYFSKSIKLSALELDESSELKRILFIIMIIACPVAVYANIRIFRLVLSLGYVAFLGGDAAFSKTFIELFFTLLLKLAFYTSFLCVCSKKERSLILGIYFVFLVSDGIKGNRSAFLFQLFFYAYYCVRKEKIIKLNFFSVLIFIISGIIFFLVSSASRGLFYGNNAINWFLYGQSTTVTLPLFFLHDFNLIKTINRLPFLFGDLFSSYSKTIVNQQVLTTLHKLPNTEAGGLGASFIVEIWDLGIFGILAAFYVGAFIKFVHLNINRNRPLNFLFITAGVSIMWLPRDCIFRVFFASNIAFLIGTNIFYHLLKFFITTLTTKRNSL